MSDLDKLRSVTLRGGPASEVVGAPCVESGLVYVGDCIRELTAGIDRGWPREGAKATTVDVRSIADKLGGAFMGSGGRFDSNDRWVGEVGRILGECGLLPSVKPNYACTFHDTVGVGRCPECVAASVKPPSTPLLTIPDDERAVEAIIQAHALWADFANAD